MAKPETVVDYDAWNRGYSPPSEHVLIDQLAYRGARVVLSSDWGEAGAFWVVMRGKRPSRAVRKAMREMLELIFEEDECSPETTSPNTSPITTENVREVPIATTDATPPGASTDACGSAGEDVVARIGGQPKPDPGKN